MRPRADRYALAYLESLSPRHLLYPPPDWAEHPKIADAQADLMAGVMRSMLDGIGVTDEQYERAIDIALEGLKAATVPGWETV
jgi:hypothetical protein